MTRPTVDDTDPAPTGVGAATVAALLADWPALTDEQAATIGAVSSTRGGAS